MLPMSTPAFNGAEHQPFHLMGGPQAALLIHGFPGTPAEMRPLGDALHAAGWTAHGLLLPGFGPQIETLLQRRQEDWSAAVAESLRALRREHDQVLLVGYSLGGALALAAAADDPPDGLALLAPFVQIDHVLWKLLPVLKHIFRGVKPFRLMKLNFADPETREGIRKFMPDADLDDPTVQAAIRDFRLPLDVFAQIQRAGGQAYRAAPRLPADLPVLVVQGQDDDLVRPTMTRQLADRLRAPAAYHQTPGRHDLLVPGSAGFEPVQRLVLDFAHTVRTAHVTA